LILGDGATTKIDLHGAYGSAAFKGDVAIGDSTTTFLDKVAIIAALTEEQRTRFAAAITAWNNQPEPYDAEDPETLPADTPLREAIVRVTTAGKINLNADGNITAAGNLALLASDTRVIFNSSEVNNSNIYIRGTNDNLRFHTTSTFDWEVFGAKKMALRDVGDLLIGGTLPASPNISLNAAGSATFANGAAKIETSGKVEVKRTGATPVADNNNPCLVVKNSDTNADAVWLATNYFRIGGAVSTNPNISLNADGSGEFAGQVIVDRGLANTSDAASIIVANNTDANAIRLNSNGSASFSGAVTSTNLAYGFTSNATSFAFTSNSALGNNGKAFYAKHTGTAGADRYLFYGENSSGEAFSVTTAGDATFAGTVTATVVPPSDARFKENIAPAKPQLADVVALGGLLKNYDWNDQAPLSEEIRSQRQLGLIAQEAAEVCHAIVKEIKRTKQGAVITPEETIPAVYEDKVIPAVYETVATPAKLGPKGREIAPASSEEVLVTPERTEQVLVTEEQVIPATYETLDDSYKGISTDALIMKLIGAVAELSAEVTALKAVKTTKK
jgi:hypothetical protein